MLLTPKDVAKNLLAAYKQIEKDEDSAMDVDSILLCDTLFDSALSLLGFPTDNSIEACDAANEDREWPEWGCCLDRAIDAWIDCNEDVDKFIAWCDANVKEFQ